MNMSSFLAGASDQFVKQEDARQKSRLELMLKSAQIEAEMQARIKEDQMAGIGADEAAFIRSQAGMPNAPQTPMGAKAFGTWSSMGRAKIGADASTTNAALRANSPKGGDPSVSVEQANHIITLLPPEQQAGHADLPFSAKEYPNGVSLKLVGMLKNSFEKASGGAALLKQRVDSGVSNKGTEELRQAYTTLAQRGLVGPLQGRWQGLKNNLLRGWGQNKLDMSSAGEDGDKVEAVMTAEADRTAREAVRGMNPGDAALFLSFTRSLVAQAARNARADLGRVSQMEFLKELETMGSALDMPDVFNETLNKRRQINDAVINEIDSAAPAAMRFANWKKKTKKQSIDDIFKGELESQ